METLGLTLKMQDEVQWAVASGLDLIDEKTLRVYKSTELVNKLYKENKLELDEVVEMYGIIADWAARPQLPSFLGGQIDPSTGEMVGGGEVPGEIERQLIAIQHRMDEVMGTPEHPKTVNLEVADAKNFRDFIAEYVIGPTENWRGTKTQRFIAIMEYRYADEPGAPPPDNGGNGDGFPGEGFQHGGVVPRTGIYLMHQGELVIPQQQVSNVQSGGTGGATYGVNQYNLNVSTMQETFSVTHEFEVMKALAGAL
jgi:hypothetical protein